MSDPSHPSVKSQPDTPPSESRSRRNPSWVRRLLTSRIVWLLVVVAVILWFGHAPLLTWAVREGLAALEPAAKLRITTEALDVRLNGPVRAEGVVVQFLDPPGIGTRFTAETLTLSWNSPLAMFGVRGRIFRALDITGLRGDIDTDFGPEPPPIVVPVLTEDQKERLPALVRRMLPLEVSADIPELQVIFGPNTVLGRFEDSDLTLREGESGVFQIGRMLVTLGDYRDEFRDLSATTTWRSGRADIAGLTFRDGLVLRNFRADFVKFGGMGLSWEVDVYDGALRGDLDLGEKFGLLHLDGTVSLVGFDVATLPELLHLDAEATGVIRDLRLTFRGNPDRAMDAEIALRLSAHNVSWNQRGWESLEIGANYIGRRLVLSNFHLAQEDNVLSANGEAAIPEKLDQIGTTRFFVNLSAEVRDMEALANLFGPAVAGTRGHLSLHGSLSGDAGELDGYVSAGANDLEVFGLPPSSAKVSAVVTTNELQIRHFEFWSGQDRINARGVFGMQAPHPYNGELSLQVADIGEYIPLLPGDEPPPPIYTGSAELNWQGDGTWTAHSGAFQINLRDVVSEFTPTGITGEFAGTYSPENIYVSLARLTQADLRLDARFSVASSGINLFETRMARGEKALLTGEAFLPLDVFAMIGGAPLADALDPARPVYVEFSSGTLSVPEILLMAGQELTSTGTLTINLTASGPLPELQVQGRLEGKNLSATVEDLVFPQSGISLHLDTEDGRLNLDGRVDIDGFQPTTIQASMPFAFERLEDGGVRWFSETAPVTGRLRFPDTSLEIFRPFVPEIRRLTGTLRGGIDLSGSLNEPRLEGGLELTGGAIGFGPGLPEIEQLAADIRFDTTEMVIRHLRGEVGAGPFELTGTMNFADAANPMIRARLTGDDVLVYRDPGVRLRMDLDLSAEGSLNHGGAIQGKIELVNGRIYRRIEITPLLVRSRVEDGGIAVPVLSGIVPDPWAKWTLDVRIVDQTPFLLVGNIATGRIEPDLTITGTLGDPTMHGVIALQNLQAYLPASDLIVPDGRISFTEDNPFMPVMDVRGYAEVSGIRVQMFAYGPLSDANFAMRSDPPFSQENLILLVTTGVAPVGMTGAGLGVVAAGQGTILILRSLARQLEPFGVNIGGLVNRVGVSIVPPADTTQGSALNAEFRVLDNFSLISGADGYGFFNAGMQYTIRFR